MSRPLRIAFPDAIYHVTARGNAGGRIARKNADRLDFLKSLGVVAARYEVICLAYCLLDNHCHLVLETPRANLSVAMQRLLSGYACAFNRRHGRVGHVFQGRYHAVVVERDSHLLEVIRYVVLNPVRAGLCRAPAQWRWSSHRAAAGLEAPPRFLREDRVLSLFGADLAVARARYRAFVADGLGVDPVDPFAARESPLFLSSREFARAHGRQERVPGVPRAHWQPVRPPLEELLTEPAVAAIAVAHRSYGYTLREIGEHLGVHATTAGRRLRRLEDGVDSAPLGY